MRKLSRELATGGSKMVRASVATLSSPTTVCGDFQAGMFGKCKNCGKQKRSHKATKGAPDTAEHGTTAASPRLSSSTEQEDPAPSPRKLSRKVSHAAALKTDDVEKAIAISLMQNFEIDMEGYLSKRGGGLAGIAL